MAATAILVGTSPLAAQDTKPTSVTPAVVCDEDDCLLGEAIGRLLYEDLLKGFDDEVMAGVQSGIEAQDALSGDAEAYQQALSDAQERLRREREVAEAIEEPEPDDTTLSPFEFLSALELQGTPAAEDLTPSQLDGNDDNDAGDFQLAPDLWRRQITENSDYFGCRAAELDEIDGAAGRSLFAIGSRDADLRRQPKVRASDTVRLAYARFTPSQEAVSSSPADSAANVNEHVNQAEASCLDGESRWSASDWDAHWFPLAGVIPGWRQALIGARPGELYRIVIGPDLAYGDAGAEGVAPGETLYYEIAILAIDR